MLVAATDESRADASLHHIVGRSPSGTQALVHSGVLAQAGVRPRRAVRYGVRRPRLSPGVPASLTRLPGGMKDAPLPSHVRFAG